MIKDIFDKITDLSSLEKYAPDSKDKELSWLELKAITRAEDESEKSMMKHQKSLLAKEICAFLNTSDGIIAWGVESTQNGLEVKNDYSGNLYELFDTFVQEIVHPCPSGIDAKMLCDKNKDFLLIFVPKSNLKPHRVWGGAEGEYRRNYYARSGTKSIALEEGLVRALYLSDDRALRASTYTKPVIDSSTKITFEILANPDNMCFIDRYYDEEAFCLLDGNGDLIEIEEDGCAWSSLERFGSTVAACPIYPSHKPIKLFEKSISIHGVRGGGTFEEGLLGELNSVLDDDIKLSRSDFEGIKLIFIRSRFACDKVRLVTDTRLFIIDSLAQNARNRERLRISQPDFSQRAKLAKLEQKYSIKIFVLGSYTDDDIDDDFSEGQTVMTMPRNDQITASWLNNIIGAHAEELGLQNHENN